MCLIAFTAILFAPAAQSQNLDFFTVQPSKIDPAITGFDDPSAILLGGGKGAPLVLFLTGTGGKPIQSLRFLQVIAHQGYKVISLSYDDVPAVSQVCPTDPDPDCSAKFREMRVYGTGGSGSVTNSVAESIERRATELLRALVRGQPDQGWGEFLEDSTPRWDHIVVSGMSQGAGMAAFIAKHNLTRRVVLFSSPWDVTGPQHQPAPWLSEKSATPPDRWFAEYHRRELTAALIINAYNRLAIPLDHILVFDNDIPANTHYRTENPFHVSTIDNFDYADRWRIMYGNANEPAATAR